MSAALGLPQRRARGLSLTALIDVVFILLMFFMITSSFSLWRSFELVSASPSSQPAAEPLTQPILVLQESGAVRLQAGEERTDWGSLDQALANEELANALRQAAEKTEQQALAALVVAPEPGVLAQSLVSAIERLNHSNLDGAESKQSKVILGDALPDTLANLAENQEVAQP
ncbi:MAG: ExbD/TolR family protein [Oceanobacter sp.]